MNRNGQPKSLQGLLALLGIAALAAALVGGSYWVSRDRISANERRAVLNQIAEVVARIPYDNDPLAERAELLLDERLGPTPGEAFPFRLTGKPAAMALLVTAPDGYSGAIQLLVGVAPDGTVLGVRAVAHRETPGLGDAIEHERSDWITQFDRRSLAAVPVERWSVTAPGAEFEQITAATVTSRAVVSAVASALLYYGENKSRLWQAGAANDG